MSLRAPSRRQAVLVGLATGGLVLLVSVLSWVQGRTSSAIAAEVAVDVTGSGAAPAVTAGALVTVAASLALALGGRWGARTAGAVIAGAGVLVAVSTVAVLADPAGPAASAAQDAVGVAVVDQVRVTWAPWTALVLAGVTVAIGAAAVAGAGRWEVADARHRRGTSAAGPRDDHEVWDALSRGEDPT